MLDYYTDTIDADLIPLNPFVLKDVASKATYRSGWTTASYTKEQLQEFIDENHSLGYRLKPTELVIDVEVMTEEGHDIDGRESFKKLCKDCDIDPATVPCVSSPVGGRHYYFALPPDTKVAIKHDDYPGIDFLSGGRYVVAAGSQHWQGGFYELDAMSQFAGLEPPEASPQLISRIKQAVHVVEDKEGGILTHDEASDCLDCLNVIEYAENDKWFRLSASVHHAAGEDAFPIWEAWCRSDPKYAKSTDIATRWDSLSVKPSGITYGTLFKAVRDATDDFHPIRKVLANAPARVAFDTVKEEDLPELPFERRTVMIDKEQALRTEETVQALADYGGVYVQDRKLVRVLRDQEPEGWQHNAKGCWTIRPFNKDNLQGELTRAAMFKQTKAVQDKQTKEWGSEKVRVDPPHWLVNQVLNAGHWEALSVIKGIVQAPTMLEGGFVLQTPGFNKKSGILYQPNQLFEPIPDNPTREDAQAAVQELYEVVHDFPFVDNAHRAVWLSAVLTMLCTHSFKGPVPLFFFDGNTSGVGKSLLIDTVGYLTSGTQIAKMAYPPNNEEMEKRLTAIVLKGVSIQLFDNVPNNRVFGFPSLDAVITGGTCTGRILGKTEMTRDMEVNTLFAATGNNMQLGTAADAARRLAYCRISYSGEDPSRRTDFLHGDLPKWIIENRSRLIKAGLTILKAYWVADRPYQKMPAWGSFEKWSESVRAPLVWVGEPDPLDTHDTMVEQADEGHGDSKLVVHGWHEVSKGEPMTAREIFEMVQRQGGEDAFPLMHEAIEVLDPTRHRNFRSIGWNLRNYSDRSVGGIMLTKKDVRSSGKWVSVRSPD